MANYVSRCGNVYTFEDLVPNVAAVCIFDKPVKKVKFDLYNSEYAVNIVTLDEDFPVYIQEVKHGDILDIPNMYGYPDRFTLNNPYSEEAVSVTIQVIEYGDSANANYYDPDYGEEE